MSLITYGSIVLATVWPTDAAHDQRLTVRQTNQVAAGIRASYPTIIPRGNRLKAITFTVERLMESLAAAEQFCHDHFTALPESGDLVFLLTDGTTEITYTGAALEAVDPKQRGLSVTIDYAFLATVE